MQLRRQAVAVPAEAPLDLLAAHGLVARHEILHEAGDDVPVVRQAVGEGRAVIEDELGRAPVDQRGRFSMDASKMRFSPPVFEDVFLDSRKARVLLRLEIGLDLAHSGSLPFGERSAA